MPAVGGAAPGMPTIATTPKLTPATVHVTAVTLGLARWDAYANGNPVVDLVPGYRFRLQVDGGPLYDSDVIAIGRGAVTFTVPPSTVHPVPAPPDATTGADASPPSG